TSTHDSLALSFHIFRQTHLLPLVATFAKDLKQIQNFEILRCIFLSGINDSAALKHKNISQNVKRHKRKMRTRGKTKYEKLHLKSWLMFSRFTDLATHRQYQLQHQHHVMLLPLPLPLPMLFDAFAVRISFKRRETEREREREREKERERERG
uniref:Uncharacterized protein n=1 Tax=Glossina palpalis gambiensis TaxID=67801 RepID=A0A1B0ANU0_9MUSC